LKWVCTSRFLANEVQGDCANCNIDCLSLHIFSIIFAFEFRYIFRSFVNHERSKESTDFIIKEITDLSFEEKSLKDLQER
jgi:hypothetical protein